MNLCGNCGSYREIDGPSMIAERLTNFKVHDLCTENEAMHRCLRLAALAAESDVPVLILGETGTGKTLLAQAIHNSSARSGNKFISFNASAMSGGPSPGRKRPLRENSNWPIRGRSFWMKLLI